MQLNKKILFLCALLCVAASALGQGTQGTFSINGATASPTGTATITVTAAMGSNAANGLTFGITETPNGSAPAIDMTTAVFTSSLPGTFSCPAAYGPTTSGAACISTSATVSGTVTLGTLAIPIPSTARSGDTYTLTLSTYQAVNSNTSTTYSIAAGSAQTLTITQTVTSFTKVSGDSQTGTVATTLTNPFAVVATDGNGIGVPNITVTFTVASGGGNFASSASTTATTDRNGNASATLTLGNLLGTNTATAAISGQPSVTFSATATTPAAAIALTIASGNNQSAQFSQLLPAPLVIKVVDQYGNGVNGISVLFTVTAGGGTLTGGGSTASVTSASGGLASVGYTAGPSATTNTIQATYSTFTAVNFTEIAGRSLAVSTNSVTFSGTAGSYSAQQGISITSSSGSISWSASPVGSFFTLSATSGTTPATLTVSVNAANLAAGANQGSITVSSPGALNSPQTIIVSLTLLAPATISFGSSALTFAGTMGGAVPAAQSLLVLGPTGSQALTVQLSASTTSGGNWLLVSPASGTAPLTATVSVNPAVLTAGGTYSGTITATSSAAVNSPQTIPVTFNFAALPLIQLAKSSLNFTSVAGGADPASQTLQATNAGGGSLVFTATAATFNGGNWLTVSGGGTNSATLTIVASPSAASLSAGIYAGTVTVVASGASNTPQVIPVTLTVTAAQLPPTLAVTPSGMLFTSAVGGAPLPQTFAVANTGSGGSLGFTITTSTATGGAWLTVTPNTNATPATITVSVATSVGGTQLAQGGYNGAITITPLPSSNATAVQTIPVGLAINAPAVEPGGLVNAAINSAVVSAGSIISLYGVNLSSGTAGASGTPLPTSLSGTKVLVGTTAIPLFYVSPLQINAQLPTGISGTITITVVSGTTTGVSTTVSVVNEAPGIFTTTGTQGAILNFDLSPNTSSNAAAVGSVIVIYATGMGTTTPPLAAGAAGATSPPFNLIVDPVTVSIGGKSAVVSFAGAAPGFAGLFQINATIPAGVTPGNAVPVFLTVGTAPQSNTVTMCVKSSEPDPQ